MLHEALDRMPHRGEMRLIDHVVSAGDGEICCVARDHRDSAYPLRLDGVLHGIALVELGAQAAAVHASVFGIGKAHTGLLLALSDVDLHQTVVGDTAPLEVRAQHLATIEGASSYRFEVSADKETILIGQALLSIRGAQ